MLLIEELRRQIADEQSLFRAQLLREDVVRLTKLRDLARSANDLDAFKKAANANGAPNETKQLSADVHVVWHRAYW